MAKKALRNKKGLSPIIATVLLVLFVLILASMIFLWARGFVSEQIEKFGQPIDKLCSGVRFEVAKTSGKVASKYSLEVTNRGDVDIYQLDIKMQKGGNTEMEKFRYQIAAGKSVKEDVILKMGENKNIDPDKITVFPALIGAAKSGKSNKIFTCLEQGKIITI